MTAREPVPPVSDIDVRSGNFDTMVYDGPATLEALKEGRDSFAVMREAIARTEMDADQKRAALFDLDLRARDLDRKFGQMLAEARLVGDVAEHGGSRSRSDAPILNLASMGIDADYGATVARFARLDDEAWAALRDDAQQKQNASRAAFDRAAKTYLTTIDSVADLAEIRRKAEQNRHEHEVERIQEFAATEPPLDVPPLTEAELSMAGAAEQLRFALGPLPERPPIMQTDDSPAARAQKAIRRQMADLATVLTATDPYLAAGPSRMIDLYGSRDVAKRLQNALSTWMRAINEIAEQERKDADD